VDEQDEPVDEVVAQERPNELAAAKLLSDA
jgi:hypothetical protein